VSRPQVIDDEQHERVHERVAAIDVAKDSGMVCTRTPHPSRPGARRSTVWMVRARMNAVCALGRQLKVEGIEIVTLESTSDCWRIWFFVLEACGLAVQLVNAAQAKNLPGRPKTDKLDAMRLARLTEMGLLRASFVPPKAVRDLRDYTRMRTRLTQERTRCWQRLEKLLESALVKVSSVASIRAIIAGQRDPKVLAALARGSMKAKHDDLVEALDGMFDDHQGELAGLLLDQFTVLDAKIGQLGARAAGLAAAMPEARGIDADGATGPAAGTTSDAPVLNAVARRRRSRASAPAWPGPSSPKRAWTWAGSPPPPTWCPGPGCARRPASPDPAPGPGRKARATPGCAGPSARPPSMPPAPAPSSASATTASPAEGCRQVPTQVGITTWSS
jgi:transposase